MHADHFIWTTYGTWLPACPRESWPRFIRSWEHQRGLHLKSLEPTEQVEASNMGADPYRLNRLVAEKTRRFPPVRFNRVQMQAIAEGFERCMRSRQAWVWACSILPDYVQLLVTTPRTPAAQMTGLLRGEATRRLNEVGLNPMSAYSSQAGQNPLMWSHVKWHQQLKDDATIHSAIEYIRQLPENEGEADQDWSFVRSFESLDRCREESEAYELEAAG